MAGGAKHDEEIISDINITPFVDVTLVLLIIFMVTATYIVAQSIPVDLPQAGTGEDVVTTLAIVITKEGQLYLDGVKLDEGKLSKEIAQVRQKNSDVRVVIAADKEVTHGRVVKVIDIIRKQGVAKLCYQTSNQTRSSTQLTCR
jgi:biopolymer transport protein ExbD